ncbi:MAG: glutathione S-transferase N-terminal domain-containing protein [Pseudomonadota bacterium]
MKVEVYGADHSPWVQAVLLGLHEKGIDHKIRSTPPLSVLRRWGVWMPAVSIDGGPWEIESAHILEKLGFAPIDERDMRAVRFAWRGVLHRTDSPLRFFTGFSRCGDRSEAVLERSLRNFLRSFIPFYMFFVIGRSKYKRGQKEPEDFGEQYLYWEDYVAKAAAPFLDGQAPGSQDLLLFGIVQCHASVPIPPFEPLLSDERLSGLRGWLAAMHERFRNYTHLYSGPYFAPKLPEPNCATIFQRGVFYCGLLSLFVLFPITVPMVIYFRHKAPA